MTKLPIFYPMGAVTENNEVKMQNLWTNPMWVAERKYDGSRYLIRKENGKVSIVSRQPSKETGLPVDKTDRVPHLAELFAERLPDGTVIDGEIITHENCESHEVTSIMGSNADVAIEKQEERGYVQYVMFDILFWRGKDLTGFKYYERRKALETIFKNNLSPSPYLLLAPVYQQNKEQVYEQIVAQGGEGVVLKNILSTYEISLDPKRIKKPKNVWVKVKKYKTFDVVIMDFTDSTKEYSGKDKDTWQYWEGQNGDLLYKENRLSTVLEEQGYIPVTKPYFFGWIGAVGFGQYKDGELIRIGQTSGISDDVKQFMTDNKEQLIGKVIEVGAMRQNKKTGALVHPRFLRFREDKIAEQCILGEE